MTVLLETLLCTFKDEVGCVACKEKITTTEKAIYIDTEGTMLRPFVIGLTFHKKCYDEKMSYGIGKFLFEIYTNENLPFVNKVYDLLLTNFNMKNNTVIER